MLPFGPPEQEIQKIAFFFFFFCVFFCTFAPEFSKLNVYSDKNYETQTLSETDDYYRPATTAADSSW